LPGNWTGGNKKVGGHQLHHLGGYRGGGEEGGGQPLVTPVGSQTIQMETSVSENRCPSRQNRRGGGHGGGKRKKRLTANFMVKKTYLNILHAAKKRGK